MVNNVAVLGHSHPAVAAAAQRAAAAAEHELAVPLRRHVTVRRAAGRAAARAARPGVPGQHRQRGQRPGAAPGPHLHRPPRRDRGRPAPTTAGRPPPTTSAPRCSTTRPRPLEPPPGLRVVPQANTYRGAYGLDDPQAGARYAEPVRDAAERGGRVHLRAGAGQRGRRAGARPATSSTPSGTSARPAASASPTRCRSATGAWASGSGRSSSRASCPTSSPSRRRRATAIRSAPSSPPSRSPTAFHRNAGFFSSVGGSPLSCEIGIAVLDAIRDEGLQENARPRRRRTCAAACWSWPQRHPLIGAVHGSGPVPGRGAGARPRDGHAGVRRRPTRICERMRELGVIVQPTGDHENVLKIKPPLCIELDGRGLVRRHARPRADRRLVARRRHLEAAVQVAGLHAQHQQPDQPEVDDADREPLAPA